MEQLWDFGAIEMAANALKASMVETEQALGDANGALATLQATWGGEASESYQVAQRKWDVASADLNRALAELSVAVSEAGGTMGTCETGNLARFQA